MNKVYHFNIIIVYGVMDLAWLKGLRVIRHMLSAFFPLCFFFSLHALMHTFNHQIAHNNSLDTFQF